MMMSVNPVINIGCFNKRIQINGKSFIDCTTSVFSRVIVKSGNMMCYNNTFFPLVLFNGFPNEIQILIE